MSRLAHVQARWADARSAWVVKVVKVVLISITYTTGSQ
jgi:hypothetical protein